MRLVWITGLLALAIFAGLAWQLAPLEPGVVALQLAFTPRGFGEIVHRWSADDLLRYRRHLPLDCVLLVLYGSFGYLLARRSRLFARAAPPLARFATWALPAAAVCDAVANAFHGWFTAAPRFGMPQLYALSAGCSLLKWVLLMGFAVAVALALWRAES